jgi:hypothetical protein
MLHYRIADRCLTYLAARILVFISVSHEGHTLGSFNNLRDIDYAPDVGAAMTDKNPYAGHSSS